MQKSSRKRKMSPLDEAIDMRDLRKQHVDPELPSWVLRHYSGERRPTTTTDMAESGIFPLVVLDGEDAPSAKTVSVEDGSTAVNQELIIQALSIALTHNALRLCEADELAALKRSASSRAKSTADSEADFDLDDDDDDDGKKASADVVRCMEARSAIIQAMTAKSVSRAFRKAIDQRFDWTLRGCRALLWSSTHGYETEVKRMLSSPGFSACVSRLVERWWPFWDDVASASATQGTIPCRHLITIASRTLTRLPLSNEDETPDARFPGTDVLAHTRATYEKHLESAPALAKFSLYGAGCTKTIAQLLVDYRVDVVVPSDGTKRTVAPFAPAMHDIVAAAKMGNRDVMMVLMSPSRPEGDTAPAKCLLSPAAINDAVIREAVARDDPHALLMLLEHTARGGDWRGWRRLLQRTILRACDTPTSLRVITALLSRAWRETAMADAEGAALSEERKHTDRYMGGKRRLKSNEPAAHTIFATTRLCSPWMQTWFNAARSVAFMSDHHTATMLLHCCRNRLLSSGDVVADHNEANAALGMTYDDIYFGPESDQ
ncbi:hypothetical protein ml_274 [Mollivirus sibericum]|uniref:hypothetical protein n=1 Tax=Mollivirus sibericum TaxID=1678078 RepID=UPI0006B2E50D|nr:hypothetical protein ml_274 [Mollivirus sibericum]ALD62076.1 hypothetical protein ml_274 [Mollivirus sibericum]